MPAELQHAMGFLERQLDARHVADAERDGHRVERAVGERQRLGVAFDEGHELVEPALRRARAADLEHGVVDVGDGDARRMIAGVHHPERDVAGAAGHIKQRERTVARCCGGFTAVTSTSFQARCSPADIRSFIRS